jgi:rare lipoprotein A
MKHHVLGSLTAALVMSSFGAPLASHAQQVDESDIPGVSSEESPDLAANATVHSEGALGTEASVTEAETETRVDLGITPPAHLPSDGPTEAEADAEPTIETLDLTSLVSDDSGPVIVQAHAFDDRQAATLYLHNLPVITFLGSELATLAEDKAQAPTTSGIPDPAAQAAAIGAQLEQFVTSQGDAQQISVRWEPTQEQYLVTLNGNALVVVNGNTILPDTTENLAADALHIANRLRRLLGNAQPLEEIEGLPQPPAQPVLAVTSVVTGVASWYGPGFHGRRAASGEVFNQNALTAAHRTLPFGTEIRVTNLRNNRQVIVRINDRGPFGHGRVLDLSAAAARAIGLTSSGTGMVRIEVLGRP